MLLESQWIFKFFQLEMYKQQIYSIGGSDGTVRSSAVYSFDTISRQLTQIYDPEKKSWTFGPSLKHARADGALFVFQNELYAIGGYNGNKYVAEIERYNPNSKCWEIYDRIPKPRAGFGITTYKGKIVIVGGWENSTCPFCKADEAFAVTTFNYTILDLIPSQLKSSTQGAGECSTCHSPNQKLRVCEQCGTAKLYLETLGKHVRIKIVENDPFTSKENLARAKLDAQCASCILDDETHVGHKTIELTILEQYLGGEELSVSMDIDTKPSLIASKQEQLYASQILRPYTILDPTSPPSLIQSTQSAGKLGNVSSFTSTSKSAISVYTQIVNGQGIDRGLTVGNNQNNGARREDDGLPQEGIPDDVGVIENNQNDVARENDDLPQERIPDEIEAQERFIEIEELSQMVQTFFESDLSITSYG
ncbi:hypothetical protein WR25_00354 [Diploscapter pachys]|uniref:Uncharacterized protein n=1 Tax=Diploscapter pachys TaxID=2018661 RepID=A0A2A2JYS6_9BILA|nr:hypothetical protein WR25_00354 [Diploscapter pachys]